MHHHLNAMINLLIYNLLIAALCGTNIREYAQTLNLPDSWLSEFHL